MSHRFRGSLEHHHRLQTCHFWRGICLVPSRVPKNYSWNKFAWKKTWIFRAFCGIQKSVERHRYLLFLTQPKKYESNWKFAPSRGEKLKNQICPNPPSRRKESAIFPIHNITPLNNQGIIFRVGNYTYEPLVNLASLKTYKRNLSVSSLTEVTWIVFHGLFW